MTLSLPLPVCIQHPLSIWLIRQFNINITINLIQNSICVNLISLLCICAVDVSAVAATVNRQLSNRFDYLMSFMNFTCNLHFPFDSVLLHFSVNKLIYLLKTFTQTLFVSYFSLSFAKMIDAPEIDVVPIKKKNNNEIISCKNCVYSCANSFAHFIVLCIQFVCCCPQRRRQ